MTEQPDHVTGDELDGISHGRYITASYRQSNPFGWEGEVRWVDGYLSFTWYPWSFTEAGVERKIQRRIARIRAGWQREAERVTLDVES